MSEFDQETRIKEKDHHSLKLWLRLLTCSSLIQSELRTLLRREFNSTLPRFDLLAQLQRAPRGLTMGEVSQRMMVSSGNVSGIAGQLEAKALISRTPVPDNRRTFTLKLTPRGGRHFKKMAERHEQWITSLLGRLDSRDVAELMKLLGRVKEDVKRNHPSRAS